MTLSETILEVIYAGDILALEGFITGDVVQEAHFTKEEIGVFWQACWEALEAQRWIRRVAVGSFMAVMKTRHPWLPTHPEGVVVSDPEEE